MKEHLLPRILARLKVDTSSLKLDGSILAETAQNTVIIKDNRVFNHKLARFYYTTYDVRRSEDVINPRTSHCDIMLLAEVNSEQVDSSESATDHPFLYARVIAIYHVNVVYVGPGMTGYEPSRFDFLHVRWFQIDKAQVPRGVSSTRKPLRLDLLSFPPTTADDAFSFVDPSLVLRSCHLIPAFSLGKKDSVKAGHIIEPWNDSGWNGYCVNRYAKIY